MDDLLDLYLNQEAIWKSVASVDEYSQPTYATKILKVRWMFANRLIRTPKGEEKPSAVRAYAKEAVKVGDVLTYENTDYLVLNVAAATALDGETLWYELAL